jgi:signal transduction histidine kinase
MKPGATHLGPIFPSDLVPLDSGLGEDRRRGGSRVASRWMGWRLRILVAAALVGCLAWFLLAQGLAGLPHIAATWRAGTHGGLELTAAADPALKPFVGQMLSRLSTGDAVLPWNDLLMLQRSPRWLIDDAERVRQAALNAQLRRAQADTAMKLAFADGRTVEVQTVRRGLTSLPMQFWLLSAAALAVFLVAMVVYLARPTRRNLLYAAMAVSQSGNLTLMAIESAVAVGQPAPFPGLDLSLRTGFDLVTAAAMIHAACLHPRHLPNAERIASGAWAALSSMLALLLVGALPQLWWWLQGALLLCAIVIIGLQSWSYATEPRPFALVMRRFAAVVLVFWSLLTLALANTREFPGLHHVLATGGPMVAYLFIASILLLLPFLSRSEQVVREFAFLAAISALATGLDLVFITVFSLGEFASVGLSLFVALASYAGARQWILSRLMGKSLMTTERMFEQVYRIAREVEAHPERTPALLIQLLRDLFEPMELTLIEMPSAVSRITGDGSTLLVPVPVLSDDVVDHGESIVIRFAQRGRRLFTSEDPRLTDRIVEQLRRAVAYDRAVERGRGEERQRLAQDLHDDIGARLLTLMYKAQSPEMEDYIRHTLQDLKTLTRGLAAPYHQLSHAAAEWKSDLTQRLTAAQIELSWSCEIDNDMLLTVTQWSALTRVLRELVSNAIAHSQAQRVDIDFRLDNDRLHLIVSDNGVGRDPKSWSHGLGLGGVRKRVKQLGGEVEWRDFYPHGISCSVTVRQFAARP